MASRTRLTLFATALSLPLMTAVQTEKTLELKPIETVVPAAKIAGDWGVFTESLLENPTAEAVKILSIKEEFLSEKESVESSKTFTNSECKSKTSIFDKDWNNQPGTLTIPAQGRALILTSERKNGNLPASLKLTVKVKKASTESELQTSMRFLAHQTAAFRFPVQGDNWRCLNSPTARSPHRKSIFIQSDHVFLPHRYSLDIVRVDAQGWTFRGNPKEKLNYNCYGEPVLAVAGGTIVEGEMEWEDHDPPAGDPETRMGNFITIDHGNGFFSHYGHLQPNSSLKLGIGQRVRAGQVIGFIGSSGNAGEPHLHFEITDGAGILHSQGLPCIFTNLWRKDGEKKKKLENEMPHSEEVYESKE